MPLLVAHTTLLEISYHGLLILIWGLSVPDSYRRINQYHSKITHVLPNNVGYLLLLLDLLKQKSAQRNEYIEFKSGVKRVRASCSGDSKR